MMIAAATQGSDWFLDGLASIEARQIRTQRQLSSGFRVQDAADSPLETAALVHLSGSLHSGTLWRSNLDNIGAEVQAADQALGSAIDAVSEARTLAARAATATSTITERQNLASQVQALLQHVVSVANTTFGGRTIFGGDQDQSAPYAVNPLSATGVDKLTSQVSTRVIENPAGQPADQALTAATIFDQRAADGSPGALNAFAALHNLANALTANDVAAINNSLDALSQVDDWLNQQQAYYGQTGKRLEAEKQTVDNDITSFQSQIAAIRDADIAQAATDLSQETIAQQAALAAQARISRKSLFDYLG